MRHSAFTPSIALRGFALRASCVFALALTLLASSKEAAAQDGPAASYDAKFEEIANSCTDVGLRFAKATIKSSRKDNVVKIEVPGVPPMTGQLRRRGSFKAAATKTTAQGIEGRFSVAGRANSKKIQMVFVAEFYRDKKAVCTQSWDVLGARK